MRWFLAYVLVCLLAAIWVVDQKAYAHEWYDRDCCDDKDCTPVKKMEFRDNGDTILYTDMFAPITIRQTWWAQAAKSTNRRPLRPSMDSGWHVCAIQFRDSDEKPIHFVRCLYTPAGG